MVIAVQVSQGCHVLIEVEADEQRALCGREIGMLRDVGADFVEIELDGPDVAHLSETDQIFDVPDRRPRSGVQLPAGYGNLIGLMLPFDLRRLPDQFQQLRNVDRLHRIAVVDGCTSGAPCASERLPTPSGYGPGDLRSSARLRHRTAVHAGRRDIQQKQFRPAMLRQRQAGRSIGSAEQNEAERRQHLAPEVAIGRIDVGDQNGLARTVIAEGGRVNQGDPGRMVTSDRAG